MFGSSNNIPMPTSTGTTPHFVTSFTSTLANNASIQPASQPDAADQIYQCSGCGAELHSQQAAWKHKTQCMRYQENARNTPEKMPAQMPAANAQQPAVQYLNDDGWIVQWFNEDKQRLWKVGIPQFKYCKKRKDHFTSSFPDVWYKAPYKYHMSLDVSNLTPEENMMAYIDMNYEDGQKVVMYQNGSGKKSPMNPEKAAPGGKSGVISNNEAHFVHSMDSMVSNGGGMKPQVGNVTIGPFQFNICSYKQDGRKFRMVIYIYAPDNTNLLVNPSSGGPQLCCCLISPSFTIRAKKPIVKPGIKGKKGDEDVEETGEKKKRGKKGGKRKSSQMSDSDDEDDENQDNGPIPTMHHQMHPSMHSSMPPMGLPQMPMMPQQQQANEEIIEIKEEPPHKRARMDDDSQEQSHAFQNLQAPLKKRSISGKSPMRMTPENSNSEFSLSFLDREEQQTPQFVDKDDLNNTINSLPSSEPTQRGGEQQGAPGGINLGMEKVYSIVQTFQQMVGNDRKQLLCRLIEFCMPHEKEFIYRKYFTGETTTETPNYQQHVPVANSNAPAVPPFMNNYMSAYQYQMIRQQQQELLDYFTSMQQQEDFAQQQYQQQPTGNMQMPPNMFQAMMGAQPPAQPQALQAPPTQGTTTAPQQAPPVYVPPGVITGQTSDVDQFFVELFD